MITKLDRYRGALVGVLAGDALLAPYETWSADRVKEDLEKRGGLVPFDYPNPWSKSTPPSIFPMGRPTDDSDQTAALAESLIACRDLNEEDLFNRLRDVTFGHKSPLWEGKALGAGKTTRDALRPTTYAESKGRSRDGAFPSNGSLMRSVPLALYFGLIERMDHDVVARMSEVTHFHPLAAECCGLYVSALLDILNEEELFELVSMNGELDHILTFPEEQPRDPEKWPGRGAAVLTLHVALWAFFTATDFRDGLTKVALIGGDTDTYGAVAGGLLGAKFGIQGIPTEWRNVLKGHDTMIKYADALYAMSHLQS